MISMTKNENNEEYQSIDDLLDYNDYEEKEFEIKVPKKRDSFNDNIAKLYEDHKNNINLNNEFHNTQRPISSYHRLNENSKKDKQGDFDFDAENELKFEMSSNNQIVELNNVLSRLNKFINKNRITENKFCDNLKLLLKFEEFYDLFKSIRFEFLNKKEAMMLFMRKNPNYEDGLISIENFLKNFRLEFKKENFENTMTVLDLPSKQLNEDFKKINSEIFDIIKRDQIEEKKKISKYNLNIVKKIPKIYSQTSMKSDNSTRPITSLEVNTKANSNKEIEEQVLINSKLEEAASQNKIKIYLRDNIQKKREEDIKIRESFDKRHNQFLEDCLIKLNEVNRMTRELKIQKNYSIFKNKDENLKCRVFLLDELKEENKFYDMSLKGLIVEWRRLNKVYQKEVNTNLVYNKTSSKNVLTSNCSSEIIINKKKLEKSQIKKEIEKMLISSIRLKTKLKQQVDLLKRNVVIDENYVLEELKKSLKLDIKS